MCTTISNYIYNNRDFTYFERKNREENGIIYMGHVWVLRASVLSPLLCNKMLIIIYGINCLVAII